MPHITLSTRLLDPGELDYLHTESDCFLLLSHGEGWGLGAFDAAASGNPVIVTGWGGTLEFLPECYPYVVEYDLLPTTTAEPDAWWEPLPVERWANARIDHAVELLRRVFEHRDEARQWGTALQSHVHESFSEARVIRALIDALDGKSTHPRPRAPVWLERVAARARSLGIEQLTTICPASSHTLIGFAEQTGSDNPRAVSRRGC